MQNTLFNKTIQNQQQNTQNNDSSYNNITEQSTSNNLSASKKQIKKKKTLIPSLIANLSDTKYPVVKRVLKNQLKFKVTKQTENQQWDLFWTDNAVQPEQLAKLKNYQKINHFPGMYSLSRKNYLARNLFKMSKQFNQDYSFYPHTWVLPSELNQLKKYMQIDQNCVLIAKPQASSQGRGIFLTKSAEDFQFGEHYVVQKYLKRPLLIDKLKFDLRIYVLVAGCDPLRVYIYKQGLARFATQPYSIPKRQNMKNLFMHLTNYAINKHSEKFKFNTSDEVMDQGHKRSLSSVLSHLRKQGHDVDKLWQEMKQIILKTLISVQPILSHNYRSCQPQNYANNMCFQILGFDIIIDQQLRSSILQVNYTPSFTTDTPLDKKIKQNLIHDTVMLMNMTQKTKQELISMKKKEMKERVLTGKKQFFSKEEREKLIMQQQIQRNLWQDEHLGNFEKVYPFNQIDSQKNEKYKQFFIYAEKCYHQGTGTNIKRNSKIPVNSVINSKKQDNLLETDPEKIKQLRQFKQNLRTNQIQMIYKTKFRPMVPWRNKNNIQTQAHGKNDKTLISQNQNNQYQSQNKDKDKEQKKIYKINENQPNKQQEQKIIIVQRKRSPQNNKNQSTIQINDKVAKVKQKTAQHGSMTVNNIKVQPKLNAIYNQKNIFKRPLSAVGNKSISTVYNITFKQISLKKK